MTTTTHGGHVYYVIKVPKDGTKDGDVNESTDSGWDNPFRPDGDLSREADEIVELIKGGKPITPTPGQNAPPLPGCEPRKDEHDSSSPLLDSTNVRMNSSPRLNQGNGNAHSTPNKANNQSLNEKKSKIKTEERKKVGTRKTQQFVSMKPVNTKVEVGRVNAQGPSDASQIEHVTLKKKPKCKCCVLQ